VSRETRGGLNDKNDWGIPSRAILWVVVIIFKFSTDIILCIYGALRLFDESQIFI
jgi:hypothetical protein